MNRKIEKLFDDLVRQLMSAYEGPEESAECMIDFKFKRCIHADHDHYKNHRVYMHVGCEENMICVSSSIELLSKENLLGLFCHEIGHLVSLQHSDMIDDSEIPEGSKILLDAIEDEEIKADTIMQELFGVRIFYDENKVQWTK